MLVIIHLSSIRFYLEVVFFIMLCAHMYVCRYCFPVHYRDLGSKINFSMVMRGLHLI